MRFIKTPTPPYLKQDTAGPTAARPPGLLGWLASLLRRPTPAYRSAPPPPPPPGPTSAACTAQAEAEAKR